MNRIVYLTLDGLLEPLGYSQVVRYLLLLTTEGFDFTIVSLEKAHSLADQNAVKKLARELREGGIEWRYATYRSGASGAAGNIGWFVQEAIRTIELRGAPVVWARGYVPAFAACIVRKSTGVPYVFDTRGYWFDERRDGGGVFENPLAYALGKKIETSLVQNSSAIVGLTRHVEEDLNSGLFGEYSGTFKQVPTCADFNEFQMAHEADNSVGKTIGYVGSFNTSYYINESFDLFRRVSKRVPEARLLVLTGQKEIAWKLIDDYAISEHQCDVRSVRHNEIARWIQTIDYGLLLCRPSFAKRASMPTKLAEFFATGVQPVAHPLNHQMRELIERSGAGFVLENVSDTSLDLAADWIAHDKDTQLRRTTARRLMQGHLSLNSAVASCSELLESLSGQT